MRVEDVQRLQSQLLDLKESFNKLYRVLEKIGKNNRRAAGFANAIRQLDAVEAIALLPEPELISNGPAITAQELHAGETVTFSLTNFSDNNPYFEGRYCRLFNLIWDEATNGATVDITLRSTDADSYLQLVDATGAVVNQDDDSAGERNSRLVFQYQDYVPPYRIAATTYSSYAVGTFSLEVASSTQSSVDGEMMWIDLNRINLSNKNEHDIVFKDYQSSIRGTTYNQPTIDVIGREPWKNKNPDGTYNPSANSYLGALVTFPGGITATVVDIDDTTGTKLYLLRIGTHDSLFINFEAELGYASPRIGIYPIAQLPDLTDRKSTVISPALDYFDATEYLIDSASAGVEDDHFIVYFPDRSNNRKVTVEGYAVYPDGSEILEIAGVQFETLWLENTGYVAIQGLHHPPSVVVPAGAPGVRFNLIYFEQPTYRVFIRVKSEPTTEQPYGLDSTVEPDGSEPTPAPETSETETTGDGFPPPKIELSEGPIYTPPPRKYSPPSSGPFWFVDTLGEQCYGGTAEECWARAVAENNEALSDENQSFNAYQATATNQGVQHDVYIYNEGGSTQILPAAGPNMAVGSMLVTYGALNWSYASTSPQPAKPADEIVYRTINYRSA